MSYAKSFAELWAEFIEENFDTDAQASEWCDKSIRQIDNYLEGICRPSPELVVKAYDDERTAESARRILGGYWHAKRPKTRSLAARRRNEAGGGRSGRGRALRA